MPTADVVVFMQFQAFLEENECSEAGLATRVWGLIQSHYPDEVSAAKYASIPTAIFSRAIADWKRNRSSIRLGAGACKWMEAFLNR
jgi:hypothetical protein